MQEYLRFGIVLSPHGGALARMQPVFQLGLGGKVGSGRQMMSWISLEEVATAIYHVLNTKALQGPVNFVSPNPVSNSEFTRILGRVLARPTLVPLPAVAARLMFGEMAEELLLGGARIVPRKLQESGYRFAHPDLEPALRRMVHGGG
jgi:uncharacterized protein (TIGR01777 family)